MCSLALTSVLGLDKVGTSYGSEVEVAHRTCDSQMGLRVWIVQWRRPQLQEVSLCSASPGEVVLSHVGMIIDLKEFCDPKKPHYTRE